MIIRWEKNKNGVKAEIETYKIKKPGPQLVYAVSFDMFSVSVFFQKFSGFSFLNRQQTNGIYSIVFFLNEIQIVDLESS